MRTSGILKILGMLGIALGTAGAWAKTADAPPPRREKRKEPAVRRVRAAQEDTI